MAAIFLERWPFNRSASAYGNIIKPQATPPAAMANFFGTRLRKFEIAACPRVWPLSGTATAHRYFRSEAFFSPSTAAERPAPGQVPVVRSGPELRTKFREIRRRAAAAGESKFCLPAVATAFASNAIDSRFSAVPHGRKTRNVAGMPFSKETIRVELARNPGARRNRVVAGKDNRARSPRV